MDKVSVNHGRIWGKMSGKQLDLCENTISVGGVRLSIVDRLTIDFGMMKFYHISDTGNRAKSSVLS